MSPSSAFPSRRKHFHVFALQCMLYRLTLGLSSAFPSRRKYFHVFSLHCMLYCWAVLCISRVPGQNIISQACYIVEIRRSGSEPSISFQEKSIFMCSLYSVCYYCSIVDCFLHYGNFPSRRGHFHAFALQCMLYCFNTGLSSAFLFRRKHFHVFVLQCMLYCFDAGLSLAYPFRSKHFHVFALQCMLYCLTLGLSSAFPSRRKHFHVFALQCILCCFDTGLSLAYPFRRKHFPVSALYSVCCIAQCWAVFCINFPSKRGHFHAFTLHCTLDFVTLLCCESLKRLIWMFSIAVPVASAMGRCRAR